MSDDPKNLEIKVTLDREDARREALEHAAEQAKMVADVRASQAQQSAAVADGARQRDEKGRWVAGNTKSQIDSMVAAAQAGVKAQAVATQQAYSAEEAMAVARNRRMTAANQAKVDEAVKALKREEFANASLTEKVGMVGSAIGRVAVAYDALGTASRVINVIGEMWQAQRDDIEKSVDRVIAYREKVLELAALKDKLGNPEPVQRELLDFRSKTLQTQDEATTFQKGALNSGQAAMGAGFISKPEFDKLMVDVGKLQAASGVSPDALGQITGSLPMMIGQKGQTAQSVYSRLAGIVETMNRGAQNTGPAIEQFRQNMGSIDPALVRSPEELASLQSAFSLSSGDQAGTIVAQFIKATTGSLTASESIGGEDSIKAKDYVKGLGMTNQNSSIEIGQAIARDMAREKMDLQSKGMIFNSNDYLAHKGIRDMESVRSLNLFAKLNEAPPGQQSTWDKTFGARVSPRTAPKYADAIAPLEQFRKTDVGGKRVVDLARDQADTSKAAAADAFNDQSLRLAFETLRADPNSGVYGEYEDWKKLSVTNGGVFRGKVLDKRKQMLEDAARKVGVPVTNDPGFFGSINDYTGLNYLGGKLGIGGTSGSLGGSIDSRIFTKERDRADAAYDYAVKIRGAGGNPLDNSELSALSKKTDETNRLLGRIEVKLNQPVQPKPLPMQSTTRTNPPPVRTR